MARTPNAADTEQIKFAERKEKRRAKLLEQAYRDVLATPAGRLVLWDIMFEARTGLAHATEEMPHLTASVWDPSSRIHYNAGRQDMGHLVQGRIRRASPMALAEMLASQLARVVADQREDEAARTPRADTQEAQHGQ